MPISLVFDVKEYSQLILIGGSSCRYYMLLNLFHLGLQMILSYKMLSKSHLFHSLIFCLINFSLC